MTASAENVSKASENEMVIAAALGVTDRDLRKLALCTHGVINTFEAKYQRLVLAIRLLATLTAILMLLTMIMIASR